jgi:TatD DNase family protein
MPGLVAESAFMDQAVPIVGYTLRGNRYLNVTNRCTLRCTFCPKFNGTWTVQVHDLRLKQEPSVAELTAAAGGPEESGEVVFCGMGEPTLRLYDILEVTARLKDRGHARIRLNTDGLANLIHGRDVTPDLEGLVDALSISLNAQDEGTYARHCRPPRPGAYPALYNFVRRAREFVPDITLTAIDGLDGVDIAACAAIADGLGVKFRRRELGKVG